MLIELHHNTVPMAWVVACGVSPTPFAPMISIVTGRWRTGRAAALRQFAIPLVEQRDEGQRRDYVSEVSNRKPPTSMDAMAAVAASSGTRARG